ncbi:aminomethyltransferase beta-barrel domain-containing protein, partial [Chryseobacterium indoltheticum]|uniref:aminomethyltransferase beta-barrel domain-containing protein n=1 Tax=Chryseobacterium indoltheticum TaxID=254 RepID=UPI0028E4D639
KGLVIGVHNESCFFVSRDMENNIIFVGFGHSFPGLHKKALKIDNAELHWVREDLRLKNGESMEVMARFRYRQELQKSTIYQFENSFFVEFEKPQSAIAEGQFAAWYVDDELIGSGVIS